MEWGIVYNEAKEFGINFIDFYLSLNIKQYVNVS